MRFVFLDKRYVFNDLIFFFKGIYLEIFFAVEILDLCHVF